MIHFVSMNVTNGTRSLAHCVSSDLHYGKGLAKQVRMKFGQMDEIKAQNCRVGEVAISGNCHRKIFHLFTKKRYFQKPTLATMEKCLWQLKYQMRCLSVYSIQIPHLGCGLDRMNWQQVLELIRKVFHEPDVDVYVCTL